MTVENTIDSGSKYIDDLDASYPAQSDDIGAEAWRHMRGIKNVLLHALPNITGAMSVSHTDLNGFFASGNICLFKQDTAPTGWTKLTTHNDKALRVVSGTASSGGSTAFSTVFGSGTTGSHTLTSAEIPGHTHTFSGTTSTVSADHTHSGTTATEGAHVHGYARPTPGSSLDAGGGSSAVWSLISTQSLNTDAGSAHSHTFSTGGISANHTHTYSGTTSSTGSGGSHSHTTDLSVQYVDVIFATKD
jgi:hypothetical protein